MLKTIVTTALLLAPLPAAAQTVSNASGFVGFDANARIASTVTAQDTPSDTWTTTPRTMGVLARAVASGPSGGTVTTFGGTTGSWATDGLSGAIGTNAGWSFAAQPGEDGVGANFGDGLSWSYDFTLDRAATLSFNYAITADGATFGLQSWNFVINGAMTSLASGNAVTDPRGTGLLTFALAANTPYSLRLTTNGNVSSGNPLNNYSGRQDGDFRFAIGGARVPEPASWALMIAGIGVVGGALRRRSALVPVAA
jgi:hypothetical protein